MALPTVNVTGTIYDPAGDPVVGAIVSAKLSAVDCYVGQYVYPVEITAVADGAGAFTLELFPNTLGELNTQYTVRARDAAGEKTYLNTTVVVPNAATTLAAIEGTHAPSVSEAYVDSPLAIPNVNAAGDIVSFIRNFNTAQRNYVLPDDSGTLMLFAGALTAGMMAATAGGSLQPRTITGTANQVIVADGNGLAGNPTLSLPQSIAATSSPTFAALTLTTPLSVGNGGTGANGVGGAWTNLGLDSMAAQAANNVSITGGAISGATIGTLSRTTGSFSLIGVGIAPDTAMGIHVVPLTLTSASQFGVQVSPVVTATAVTGVGVYARVDTAAAAFAVDSIRAFRAANATLGAGSSLVEQIGFLCDNLTSGTNNYGFRGSLAAGASKWNAYMDGTAFNYFAGNTGVMALPVATTALLLPAGTTGISSLRIPHGAAPTAPVDGDVWTTSAGAFVRINGVTKSIDLT